MSRGRRVRNVLATIWMIGVGHPRTRAARLRLRLRRAARASKVVDWQFLTEDIPIISRKPGGGMYPAIVGTLVITFWAAVMAVPLGVLAAIYLNEYGGRRRLAALHPVHGRRHDRRAVDRDGPVHLHDLGAERTASPGSPVRSRSARLMLPIVIRSTEEMLQARPRRPAAGERRAGRAPLAHDDHRRAAGRAARHRVGRRCSRSPARPARPRRCCSRSARARKANWNAFEGANTALSVQIFSNAKQPFPAAQDRAWGAALTLIVIVFICTIIARVVSSRFATKTQ